MDRIERLAEVRDVLAEAGPLATPEVARAVAAACVLVAAADGHVTDDETEQIATTLQLLAGAGAPDVAPTIGPVAAALEMRGRDAVLADVASALPDPALRRRAFAWAAGVAYVDDFLDFEEEVLLLQLADALEIPRPEAQETVDRIKSVSAT